MTLAPSILFACTLWASPSPATEIVSTKKAILFAGGGIHGLLPTLSAGAAAGLWPGADLFFHYDTHAALQHTVSFRGRLAVADRLAVSLSLSHEFFVADEISGVDLLQAPYGNGTASSAAIVSTLGRLGSARLAGSTGLSVRFTTLVRDAGTIERRFDATIEHVYGEISATWPLATGALYLVVRATIPLGARFSVIGYVPWVTVGRSFELL
jgi:hypothetical protein